MEVNHLRKYMEKFIPDVVYIMSFEDEKHVPKEDFELPLLYCSECHLSSKMNTIYYIDQRNRCYKSGQWLSVNRSGPKYLCHLCLDKAGFTDMASRITC